MGWIIALIIAAAALGYFLYRLAIIVRQRREASKIIRFSLDRRNPKYADRQKCSFCKKKTKRLSFYAVEDGRVVGVCDTCKPIAERRALLRL